MRYKDRDLVEAGDLVFEMPTFIQDFGHRGHHNVPAYNPAQEHTVRVLVQGKLHEAIEYYLLYPLRTFFQKNDGRSIAGLDVLLSLVWGFVCGFEPRHVLQYFIWELKGCPAYRVWKRPQLLEVLLERDAEEGAHNRRRHQATVMFMKMNPMHDEEPLSGDQILENFLTGMRRSSRLILDNLGIMHDVTRGYLIHALENGLGFDLGLADQHKAFKSQIWRQAAE